MGACSEICVQVISWLYKYHSLIMKAAVISLSNIIFWACHCICGPSSTKWGYVSHDYSWKYTMERSLGCDLELHNLLIWGNHITTFSICLLTLLRGGWLFDKIEEKGLRIRPRITSHFCCLCFMWLQQVLFSLNLSCRITFNNNIASTQHNWRMTIFDMLFDLFVRINLCICIHIFCKRENCSLERWSNTTTK